MEISVNDFATYLAAFCTPNTVVAYKLAARRFVELHADAAGVAPDSLVRYVAACHAAKLGPATIAIHMAGLKHLLAFARQRGVFVPDEKDMADLHLPRVRGQVAPTMTRDELGVFDAICCEIREPLSTLMRLLPATGMRISEACGLLLADATPPPTVDGSYVIAVRPNGERSVKGKSDREVVVLTEATPMLDRHCAAAWATGSPWMFTGGRSGGPIKRRVVAEEFRKVGAKMGRGLSPHACRHAHATILHDAGWSVKAIGEQLGHENAQTTLRYISMSTDKRRELMAGVRI